MNNNPNENLNQTQGATTNNVTVQNASSREVKEVLTEASEPVANPNAVVNESSVNNAVNVEQRVNLVNDKPAIQSVVPNNPVSVTNEETVEVLEPSPTDNSNSSVTKETKQVGKTIFLIILFGGLFAVVFFLPDISKYIETQKYMQTHVEEKITDGVLKCKYEDSTDTLDYNYSLKFDFSDNKLNELEYLLEIRGDANLDESELEERKKECDQLMSSVETIKGVSVTCSLSNGLYKQKQTLVYSSINQEAAITAYTEAGGIYPDYEKGDNMDEIERNMNASGYTCERIKSLT